VLRIGYVSPDFRRHPVGYFMRPIFAHHDPEQVEVFVYSDLLRGDIVTEFFRSHAHTWRDTHALTDEELAEQIRADEIDILIDLTLHMAHSRLLTFARKPAPVQATYLGYAHGTGLAAMDYKLTDRYLDPPGMNEAFHTETLVRLPTETNFCCEPEPGAPEVGELPARAKGYVTFSSTNTLMKINAKVIETWCQILQQVPGARLLLTATALASPATQERVRARFTAHGIAADRIEIGNLAGVESGFSALAQADIALDTFPYNGGTTTANALWMGLPVITLAGQSPISRQGVSFLSNLRLTELIARSREQYVSIAVDLARDLDRLAALRAGMRERMLASPIMDGAGFVLGLEGIYRAMWSAYCASSTDI
jgi:predicted O-linked N-acetylglucosamine transferase (SPINDLY family)